MNNLLRIIGILEMHIAEDDLLVETVEGYRLCRVVDGIVGTENLINTLHGSEALRYLVTGLGKILERIDNAVEDDHVEDKRRGIDGRMIAEDECAAEPQHNDNDASTKELTDGVSRGLTYGDAYACIAEFIADSTEACQHLVLCNERLDYTQAAEHLIELTHGLAPLGLRKEALGFQLSSYTF